jgi:GTP-binding protein
MERRVYKAAQNRHSMTPALQHSIPVLAIVGRPNVGKSTLFNRIAGRRIAIVHEQPGVTRDRVSAEATWREKPFEVIDTGGIAFLDEEKTRDALAAATRRQAEVAMEAAAVIILVVDVTEGVVPLDLEIAGKLRASGKPIFLAVNKVDNDRRAGGAAEFSQLGFEQTFAIAAAHGTGVAELLDAATREFPRGAAWETERPTRIAIVGRPNVGKSSLINAILQDDRTIVSDIPGTTRDSVDVPFRLREKPYLLVDTAGLRHRRKIRTSVDQFGLMRAERSIRECDIGVLVLDAVAGVTKQDKKIAGQIAEAGRGCVVLVNKWDLAAEEERRTKSEGRKGKETRTQPKSFRELYEKALRRELFFLDWAPVLFASAKTGENLGRLFDQIAGIEREMMRRVETPQLNKLLMRALDSYPPPFVGGKRFKIYYAFQRASWPPTFRLFVNHASCLTPHYQRFLTDKIRAAWGFTGCPIVLECRQRERRQLFKAR